MKRVLMKFLNLWLDISPNFLTQMRKPLFFRLNENAWAYVESVTSLYDTNIKNNRRISTEIWEKLPSTYWIGRIGFFKTVQKKNALTATKI